MGEPVGGHTSGEDGEASARAAPPSPSGRALARNMWLLCLLRASHMALVPMAILTVFLERRAGFEVLDIMLLQGVFGLGVVLFEFPSGYLADRLGYRRCLILAFALWSVAWPLYGLAGGWTGVAVAELLLGVGMALVSGCDTALLYESLLARGREAEFARWAGRQTFAGQLSEGAAALVAGLLFALAVALPFFVQGALSLIGLGLALALVEAPRERPSFSDSAGQIRAMLRHVARENRELRALFFAAVVLGLASFVPVWTIQLYALEAGLPEAGLGPLWAVANFCVAAAALLSHRLLSHRPLVATVLLCTALAVFAYLGLGLSHALYGFAFYYGLTLLRGLAQPVLHHREQQLVPSRDRAGFLSLRSMAFRLGFLAIGPLVGFAVDGVGQHPTMLALAALFGLAGAGAAWSLARARSVATRGTQEGAPREDGIGTGGDDHRGGAAEPRS